jgi:hypothetical protein
MTETTEQEIQDSTPKKLAFVLDNKVVDVLRTDERLAAIFLSQPIVVDVTGPDGSPTTETGYNYDPITGNFFSNKPFESWTFDQELGRWKAPVDFPIDGRSYHWNEESLSWILES